MVQSSRTVPWRWRWLAPAFVWFAAVAVYSSSLNNGLLAYDDRMHLVRNPYMNPPTTAGLARMWQGPFWGEYVPVTYTVWWIQARLALLGDRTEIDPRVFHFTNVALHAATAVVVWAVLRRLTFSLTAATLATLLFAIHPLQTESVAWVSETRGLLAGLLGFTSLALYIEAVLNTQRATSSGGRTRSGRRYLLATAAYVLALLSKSSGVAIVPMAAIIDVLLLRRSVRVALVWLLPWLAAAALLAVIMSQQQGVGSVAYRPPLWERPLLIGAGMAFYLAKLVVPLGLCADYGWNPLYLERQPWFYALWLLPAVLLMGALLTRRGGVSLAVLLLLAAGVAPVSGLLPFSYLDVSLVADRFFYLSMFAAALGLAALVDAVDARILRGAAFVILLIFAILSARQVAFWRNDETLATRTLSVNPRSVFASGTLAQRLASGGSYDVAEELLRNALSLNPRSVRARINWAHFNWMLGREDEALEALQEALELHPTSSMANRMMAELLVKRGRFEEATDHCEAALRYGRRDREQAANHAVYGSLLLRLGRVADAQSQFEQAFELDPNANATIWAGYAAVLAAAGDRPAAIEACERAERLLIEPVSLPLDAQRAAEVWVLLARNYLELGDATRARTLAREAAKQFRARGDQESLAEVERLLLQIGED